MTGYDYSSPSRRRAYSGRRAAMRLPDVGPAPVSIQQYQQVVKAQAAQVRFGSVRACGGSFDDLVLPDGFAGPAWTLPDRSSIAVPVRRNRQRQTSIAERLRALSDAVLVPYAHRSERPHHRPVCPWCSRRIPFKRRPAGSAWRLRRACSPLAGTFRRMLCCAWTTLTVSSSRRANEGNNGILHR